MSAFTREHYGPYIFGRVGKERIQFCDQGIIHCVTLLRAVKNNDGGMVVDLDARGFFVGFVD